MRGLPEHQLTRTLAILTTGNGEIFNAIMNLAPSMRQNLASFSLFSTLLDYIPFHALGIGTEARQH